MDFSILCDRQRKRNKLSGFHLLITYGEARWSSSLFEVDFLSLSFDINEFQIQFSAFRVSESLFSVKMMGLGKFI